MKTAIAYTRVSTKQQGRSGLGLAAQRDMIDAYAANYGVQIIAWHQDVQTGKGADPLPRRPGLRAAIDEARKHKAALVVAKLDRLARNAAFINTLMERRDLRLVVATMPDADNFALQIYAALAENERNMIAERTRAGLAKLKGTRPLGMANKAPADAEAYRAKAKAAQRIAADQNAEALRPLIEFALKNNATLRQAATTLNERRVATIRGNGRWHPITVLKVARRLGLREVPQP